MPPASLQRFWDTTFPTTRAAFALGGIAALINILTYAGLDANGARAVVYLVHLVVMAFGVALFVLIGQHHWLSLRTGPIGRVLEGRIPWPLLMLTIGSVVYGLALFLWLFRYGEGGPELRADGSWAWIRDGRIVQLLTEQEVKAFDAGMLRVFSAWWLFFSLIIGLTWHTVRHRMVRMRRSAFGESAA